jgi:hypothetical protein
MAQAVGHDRSRSIISAAVAGTKVSSRMPTATSEDNPAMAGIDIYVELLRALESEVETLGIGLKLDHDGVLRLTRRVRFQPSGTVAPMLAEANRPKETCCADCRRCPWFAPSAERSPTRVSGT